MEKLSILIRSKFYGFFCWFPCITALFFSAIRLLYPDLDGRKASLLFVLLFLCICGLTAWFVIELRGNTGKRVRMLYMPLLVFGCAVSLRLFWVTCVGPCVAPFSDFDWAYQAATGSKEYINHHATFPSWGFYVGILKLIFKLGPTLFTSVQFFNAIINSISVVLVYYIALVVADEFRIAVIAALLFCFMPSNILYTNMLSPEFLTIVLILFVTLLMAITFKWDLKLWLRILLWVMIGFICAVADYLKAGAMIILIAYAITLFVFLYKNAEDKELADSPRPLLRTVAIIILSLVLIAIPFYLTGKVIDRYVEKELGVPINQNPIAHFLFVGLNTKGEGQIHIGEYNHRDLEFLAAHDYDYELTGQWVKDFLKQDWSENYEDVLALFVKKTQWAWQDDIIPAQYTIKQISNSDVTDKRWLEGITQYGPSLLQIYYTVLVLFTVIGSFAIKKYHERNRGFFLICMYIFGFALMLIISEAQSRYKCMIMPMMCILSAVGLAVCIDNVKVKFMNQKEKRLKID